MSFGIDVSIPINISLKFQGNLLIVGLSSTTELNKLTWTLKTIQPFKKVILNEGKTMILFFVQGQKLVLPIVNNMSFTEEFKGGEIVNYIPGLLNETPVVQQSDVGSLVGVSLVGFGALALLLTV